MTKSQHEALIKFSQVSQQRELCDMKEKKMKRFRAIAIFTFLTSIILIVAYQLAVHTAFLPTLNFKAIAHAVPGKEYTFLIVGIISFLFLLVSVFKSIGAEIKAEHARRLEGRMAQKAFVLMLVRTRKDY